MRRKLIISLAILLTALALALAPAVRAAEGVKSLGKFDIHYGEWADVADALAPYLDVAFDTARDVTGYGNEGHGKMNVYLYSDPASYTTGYHYSGENDFYLNLRFDHDTSAGVLGDYGATAAHEVAHVFFDHKVSSKIDFLSSIWLNEALAYYIGSVAYPYGPRYSKDFLGFQLKEATLDGRFRETWYMSGVYYQFGMAWDLDFWQLNAIGQFLASNGWGNIHRVLDRLAGNPDIDDAFRSVYGKETGMHSTKSGAKVNTLYSEYINYYLGHY